MRSTPPRATRGTSSQVRRPAPFHFLHYGLVVGQQRNAKRRKMLTGHFRDEPRKSCVQDGDAIRKADPVAEEAVYHFPRVTLVGFHRTHISNISLDGATLTEISALTRAIYCPAR